MDRSGPSFVRLVEEAEAEAVLSLRLFVPGVFDGEGEGQHHLARSPRPREFVSESRVVNPDGSITETYSGSLAGSILCTDMICDGRTADGRGCGGRSSVSVSGRRNGLVAVSLSWSWNDGDGNNGAVDEVLLVAWPGTTRKVLGSGAGVEATIKPIGTDGGVKPGPRE